MTTIVVRGGVRVNREYVLLETIIYKMFGVIYIHSLQLKLVKIATFEELDNINYRWHSGECWKIMSVHSQVVGVGKGTPSAPSFPPSQGPGHGSPFLSSPLSPPLPLYLTRTWVPLPSPWAGQGYPSLHKQDFLSSPFRC